MKTIHHHYAALGLKPNASPEEIRRRFRELAHRFHPDTSAHSDTSRKFQEVHEAYRELTAYHRRLAEHNRATNDLPDWTDCYHQSVHRNAWQATAPAEHRSGSDLFARGLRRITGVLGLQLASLIVAAIVMIQFVEPLASQHVLRTLGGDSVESQPPVGESLTSLKQAYAQAETGNLE